MCRTQFRSRLYAWAFYAACPCYSHFESHVAIQHESKGQDHVFRIEWMRPFELI